MSLHRRCRSVACLRRGADVTNEHQVGDTAPNPAPESFIWPSDHAGMVAMIATGG